MAHEHREGPGSGGALPAAGATDAWLLRHQRHQRLRKGTKLSKRQAFEALFRSFPHIFHLPSTSFLFRMNPAYGSYLQSDKELS